MIQELTMGNRRYIRFCKIISFRYQAYSNPPQSILDRLEQQNGMGSQKTVRISSSFAVSADSTSRVMKSERIFCVPLPCEFKADSL
jgi:hypothetical protein